MRAAPATPKRRVARAMDRLEVADRQLLALLLLEHLTPDEAARALREPVRLVRRRAAAALARLAHESGFVPAASERRAA